MRNAFADEILKQARANANLTLVTADIGNRLFDAFKAEFPDRFLNCGVAEANMTGIAAGMASQGLKTFTYTITPFATTRCLEQIRVDLCYHDLPVTVCGVGSGYAYGPLGATHHACEDISLLRSLPNMAVVCPCDPLEMRALLAAAVHWTSPLYLRLGKKGEANLHSQVPDVAIGRALVMRPGEHCCLLSTGTIMPLVLEVSERLRSQGISCEVVSMHTVKPLDADYLAAAARRFPLLVTVEEHSLIGGLGSAVAEWMVDAGPSRTRLVRVGTPDRFIKDCGETHYIHQQIGLTAEAVTARILAARES